jgi:hypothetical protein
MAPAKPKGENANAERYGHLNSNYRFPSVVDGTVRAGGRSAASTPETKDNSEADNRSISKSSCQKTVSLPPFPAQGSGKTILNSSLYFTMRMDIILLFIFYCFASDPLLMS